MELLQLQSDEGPCLECVTTGARVNVPNLATQQERWPTFSPAAMSQGFTAVRMLCPCGCATRRSVVSTCSASGARRSLDDDDLRIAQALAEACATIAILQQRSLSRSSLLAEQLQSALDFRIVVEQAKGVLAERGTLDMPTAFARLREYARAHQQKLSDVAANVVHQRAGGTPVLQGSDSGDRSEG